MFLQKSILEYYYEPLTFQWDTPSGPRHRRRHVFWAGCEGEVARQSLGKPVALDAGQTFVIHEGGRTVGAGTVMPCSTERAGRNAAPACPLH